jgi:hypothetical protein
MTPAANWKSAVDFSVAQLAAVATHKGRDSRWPAYVSAIDLAVLQGELIRSLAATVDAEVEKFLERVRSQKPRK